MLLALLLATTPVDDADLEITVVANPFARFDHTRWRLDSHVGLPFPATMYATTNEQARVAALDIRLIAQCELDGEAMKRRAEVTCTVEDAAVTAVFMHPDMAHADVVLDELVTAMKGRRVQLQVADHGAVLDVGLLDEPQTNRRVNAQMENVRQLLMRAFLGFHIGGPNTYKDDVEWVERNSRLMTLPVLTYGGGTTGSSAEKLSVGIESPEGEVRGRTFEAPPQLRFSPVAVGNNTIVSRCDLYKGQLVVQSKGSGSVNMSSGDMVFAGELDSVGIYDDKRGYMTERRFNVTMNATAGSALSIGTAGWPYWHVGSLYLLGPDEPSVLGPSVVIDARDTAPKKPER